MQTLMLVILPWIAVGLIYAEEQVTSIPRIAVVGAGIGGTSASYFLQELFGSEATIDLYEAKNIGGRIAAVKVGDRFYESGASVFHPLNEYLVNFTKILGLKKRTDAPSSRLGLYDGKGFPFSQSVWSIITLGNILWRYGMDLININSYVNKMIGNFSRIYSHQRAGQAFTSVENLLNSMCPEFVELTKISTRQHLTDVGMSKLFIDEFVTAALRVNYGQDTNTQAFVGSMSIAGVQGGLWAVAGGNNQIPQKLLTMSKANFIQGKVTKVVHMKTGKKNYQLFYERGTVQLKSEYDIVILATPLSSQFSSVQLEDVPIDVPDIEIPYHRTVATFFEGIPNISNFGFSTNEEFIEQIMSIDYSTFYNSFARQYPVDYDENTDKDQYDKKVFKVFSQNPLTETEKEELLISRDKEQVVDWLAYPHYGDSKEKPPFVLSDNLYYINAIEAASSAAEVVVIGAKNVANLAFNFWNNLKGNIDATKLVQNKSDRTEL